MKTHTTHEDAKGLNFNELTSLKKSDFDERGFERVEGSSGASISVGGFAVRIYYSPDGYFPIVRGFRGERGDYELDTYKTLQQAKSAIRNAFITGD